MKLWRRAAEGVIGAGLSLIVLGLGGWGGECGAFSRPARSSTGHPALGWIPGTDS